jgi:small-conductance mechanosensitive channel
VPVACDVCFMHGCVTLTYTTVNATSIVAFLICTLLITFACYYYACFTYHDVLWSSYERLQGSWYLVTVTASPANAEKALQACKDTIKDMATSLPVTYDNVESAQRVLINRYIHTHFTMNTITLLYSMHSTI